MFKLKFDQTYNHHLFYKYDEVKPVQEDYYLVSGNVFCVADGITKDLTDGTATPYPTNLYELKLLEKYPNPSMNYEAAKICCSKFVEYIKAYNEEEITEELIQDIAKRVNSDVCKINENREIDYLTQDVHSCQAVGGIIIGDYLYCFSIGDTQITLLDEQLNIIFDTPANEKFAEYEKKHLKDFDFDWDNPEVRYVIRKNYRNNPTIKHEGEDISFGALGEKDAEYYINSYKLDLKNVKYICSYSDGARSSFETEEGRKMLINNPESIKESGSEKTLVIYEKE